MKRTISSEKLFYRELVAGLLPYADKQLEVIKDKLNPGATYTAADIVKIVGVCEDDTYRTERIETERGSIAIAEWNIFHQIKMCEKHAGLIGKKAHTWIIPESRSVAVSASMTFGPKRQMKALASMMKRRTRNDYEVIVLSLADGCLRPIGYHKNCPVDSHFRLKAVGYEVPQEFSRLSFKISCEQFKEMYEDCKLYIYKDVEPTKNNRYNPYHVRIVIENADGKCISSNEVIPISEEYIKMYDKQFTPSYEDDYKPIKPKKIIETEHTEAVNNQVVQATVVSATLDPSNGDHAIPVSSDNKTAKMQDAPDISDSKDTPNNLRRLELQCELHNSLLYQKGIITYIPPTPDDCLRLIEAERKCSPAYPPDSVPDSDLYIEHNVKKLIISRN